MTFTGKSKKYQSFTPPGAFETTIIPVRHPDRFRIADQIQVMDSREVMLVICVYTNKRTIQVLRGYGGTSLEVLPTEGGTIRILGSREKVAAWRKRRKGRTKYLSVSVSHHDHNCIGVHFIEPPESQALEG